MEIDLSVAGALCMMVSVSCVAGSAAPDLIRRASEITQEGLKSFEAGQYQEAVRYQKRALEIWTEVSRNHTVDLAAPHFNLAQTYLAQGKLTAAERHARLARQLAPQFAMPSDRSRFSVLIAHIHFDAREYAEAERELRAAIPELAGVDKATALSDLGMTRAALGDLAGARRFLNDSLAAREQAGEASGPDHGRVLANLALVCFRQGDLSASASLYDRAIPLLESASGPLDGLHTGIALAEYSQVLRKSGRKSEAKIRQQQANAILNGSGIPFLHTVDVRSIR